MTLTSTQHRLLSGAAQRDDRALELPTNLKGGVAAEVAAKLLADGLFEFSNSEGVCFDAYAREPILFSNDSKDLWLVCAQYTAPKPDDLMAIRLDVPSMRVREVRRYGDAMEDGREGLERIGGSV